MRKQTIGLAAALLGGTMAVPALADVTVFATIDKTKTVTITEELNIRKDITVFVVMGTIIPPPIGSQNQPTIDPKNFFAAAEADAIVNVVNKDNVVGPDLTSGQTPQDDRNVTRTNLIRRSINFNQGIVGVNQDTGDNNNQSNVVALAFTDFPDSLVNAQVAVDQLNTSNESYHREDFPTVAEFPTDFTQGELNAPTLLSDGIFNTNVDMWDSVNRNIGIVGVNQNGGNNNNQTNAVAVAAGLDAGLALAETALGQENSNNIVEDTNTLKRDRIGGNSGSINNNTGIVSVNQSAGANNNQSGAVSIAASTTAVGALVALGTNNNAL